MHGGPGRFAHFGRRGDAHAGMPDAGADAFVALAVGRDVEQRGLDEAGHQIAHRDAILGPFAIERFGDRAHAELGRRIDRPARHAIEPRGTGGVEQARTRRARLQIGIGRLRAKDHALEVDIQRAFNFLGRAIDQRPAQRNAGVVEQHVDPAGDLRKPGQRRIPRRAVTHIEQGAERMVGADQAAGFGHARGIDIADADKPALARKFQRHRPPDARSPAGDENRAHPVSSPAPVTAPGCCSNAR